MELIPVQNFLFLLLPLAVVWYYYRKWVDNSKAVGIVSLPGMMTGQILSGVDPLIAVRYQIYEVIQFKADAN